MVYLIPVFVVIFGLAADLLVQITANISSEVLLEIDPGVKSSGGRITADYIVDMRPEASLSGPLPSSLTALPPGR
ncbi:hypothetical protein ABLE91_18070 [Aquabacter sp. CN5-332]|uniref:hypothetical protein n=1 Tax=Aquabacter sp. CN5-332 TaxID=3156608 RepID=UPI0032B5CED2